MDSQKFVLWIDRPEIRHNAMRAIEELPIDSTWDISIKRHVDSKTAKQRAWFHALCGMMAEQIDMQAGDFKEIAKSKLFGWKQVSYGGVTLTMADGHSEKLGKMRYSELIETVYLLASETGISLPEPDTYRQ